MLSCRLGEEWRALSWAPDANRLERLAPAPAGGPAAAQAPRVKLQDELCSTGSADHGEGGRHNQGSLCAAPVPQKQRCHFFLCCAELA